MKWLMLLFFLLVFSSCQPQYIDEIECGPSVSHQYGVKHWIKTTHAHNIDGDVVKTVKSCNWGKKLPESYEWNVYFDSAGIPSVLNSGKNYIHFNHYDEIGPSEYRDEILTCAKFRYLTKEEEIEINDSEENCLYELALLHRDFSFCELIEMNPTTKSLCVASFNETEINNTKMFSGVDIGLYCSPLYYEDDVFFNMHPNLPDDHYIADAFTFEFNKAEWCDKYKTYIPSGDGRSYTWVKGHFRSTSYRPSCATCGSRVWVSGHYRSR